MMTRKPLYSILILACLTACHTKTIETRPTIDYVRGILSDRNTPEYRLLSGNAEPRKTGDIVVVGSSVQCAAVSTQMSVSDVFDNLDGTRGSDGLADFSGEYITSIVDDAGGSYASYLAGGRGDQLRENTVRSVIAAIDSTYSLTAYDLDGKGRKSPAKVVVLSDVQQYVYGGYDVDTLMTATGCGVNILYPIESMVRFAVPAESEGSLKIGVIASPEVKDSTIYQTALNELLPGRDVSCYAVRTPQVDTADVVLAFLDSYIASGETRPVDVILVDDYSLTPSSIRQGIWRASSLMSSESLVYGKYLSDNLKFACPAEAVSAACYRILREQNLFTHKITLPHSISFKTMKRPEGEGILLTPISFYVQD